MQFEKIGQRGTSRSLMLPDRPMQVLGNPPRPRDRSRSRSEHSKSMVWAQVLAEGPTYHNGRRPARPLDAPDAPGSSSKGCLGRRIDRAGGEDPSKSLHSTVTRVTVGRQSGGSAPRRSVGSGAYAVLLLEMGESMQDSQRLRSTTTGSRVRRRVGSRGPLDPAGLSGAVLAAPSPSGSGAEPALLIARRRPRPVGRGAPAAWCPRDSAELQAGNPRHSVPRESLPRCRLASRARNGTRAGVEQPLTPIGAALLLAQSRRKWQV